MFRKSSSKSRSRSAAFTTFSFKKYKGTKSKAKVLHIDDKYIADDKQKPVIKLKNIKQIAFGKHTDTFTQNTRLNHKPNELFLSIIAEKDKNTLDLETLNKGDRSKFITCLLTEINKSNKGISQSDHDQMMDDNDAILLMNIIDIDSVDQGNKSVDTKESTVLPVMDDKNKTEFKVHRFKQKGHKEKIIKFGDQAIVDNEDRIVIKYKDISKIAIGKKTEVLMKNEQTENKSHSYFFSFIQKEDTDKPQQTIDLQVLDESDRYLIIIQTLIKLKKNKPAIRKVIASYAGKDESFMISISHRQNDENQMSMRESQNASKEAFEDALRKDEVDRDSFDESKRKWTFKRHKFKGSKSGSVELTKSQIIWNEKNKMALTDVKQIMLGKQSELLSDPQNKHFSKKPNEIFISFISDKETFDFSEIEKNDRMDLMFKVLAELREIQHKVIEGDVNEDDIMRRSTMDENYRASFVIVEDEEEQSMQPSSVVSEREPQTEQSSATWNEQKEAQLQSNASEYDALSREYNEYKDQQERLNDEAMEENENLQEELRDLKYDLEEQAATNKKLQKQLEEAQNASSKSDISVSRRSENWENRNLKQALDKLQAEYDLKVAENEKLRARQPTVRISKHQSKDFENIQAQSKKDQKKIMELKEELAAALSFNKSNRDTIVGLETKLKQSSKSRNYSDGKLKAERLKYIEVVRSVLSEADWVHFRRLMKNVANHAQKSKGLMVDKDNYNRKRHLFVDKLVYDLYNIFDEYPMAQHHLMRDFEVVIPNETERYMFIQSMMNEKDNSRNVQRRLHIDNRQIYQEFEEKVKLMQQQVTDQTELQNSKFELYENQKIILSTNNEAQIELNLFADKIKKESQNTDPNRVCILKHDECDMVLHGIAATYPMKIKAMENTLMIGRSKFPYRKIYKIEIGDTSLFHGSVDQHCCMILLTSQGTIQLEAPSQLLRDQWLRQIELQNAKEQMISFQKSNMNDIRLKVASPTHYEDMNQINELAVGAEAIYTPENVYKCDNLERLTQFSFQENYPFIM